MRKLTLKKTTSIFLCLVLLFVPIHVSANGIISRTVIPPREGVRSEMISIETEFDRTTETTDVDGNHIKVIYDKVLQKYQLFINDKEINLDSKPSIKRAPISRKMIVLGNFARNCEYYQYSTLDLREELLWQGTTRVSFVWRITDNSNHTKELFTLGYDMPKDYGTMMLAINDLNAQCIQIVKLLSGVAISATAFAVACASGIAAIEALAFGTAVATALNELLYSPSGLQDRIDACEIAYQTYGNS